MIGVGIGPCFAQGGGGFSPASIFASGEQGAWYDVRPGYVFQDAAGTTPAGVGDPVGHLVDRSGNGNHATQSTASSRPVLRQSDGLYYIDFDGVDDELSHAGMGISGATSREIMTAGVNVSFTIATAGVSGRRWTFRTNDDLARVEIEGSGWNSALTDALAVWGCRLDGSTLGDHTLSKNTTDVSASGVNVVDTLDDATSLGSVKSSVWVDSHFYNVMIIDRILTTPERTSLRAYMASRSGVTL